MKDQELISVVIPVYNCAPFLQEAISSIQKQTYRNIEIICVDDASTDGSLDVLEKLALLDKRIKIYNNPQNMGISKTLNFAISKASGNYIARMDGDDIALPERFDEQMRFLQEHPEVDIVGSWLELFGARNEIWYYRRYDEFIKAMMLFRHNGFGHNAILVRKRFYEFFQYDPNFDGVEDTELWTRAIIAGYPHKFANIPKVLTRYRMHNVQTSHISAVKQRALYDKILNRYLASLGLNQQDIDWDSHNILVAKQKKLSMQQLEKSGVWVKKLSAHYNAALTDEYFCIDERWFRLCYAQSFSLRDKIYKTYSVAQNKICFI